MVLLYRIRCRLRGPALAWLLLALAASSGRADSFEERYQQIRQAKGDLSEAERLHRLFRVDWEYNLETYPEFATYVGYPGQDHRWTDWSIEAVEGRKRELQRPLAALRSIERQALGPADQLNYDLFAWQAELALAESRFPGELLALNQLSGVHQDAAQILSLMPARTVADFEDQIGRLRRLPEWIDQTAALLQLGLERGVTPPRITLQPVPEQVLQQAPENPWESPVLQAFADESALPAAQRERLRAEALEAYREIRPAFLRLHQFLTERYLPGARQSIGFSEIPQGESWYALRLRQLTTTELTPEQIHQIGLQEVRRIRQEMERVKEEAAFAGGLDEFFEFLRTDRQFFFEDEEELLRAYRDIAKRADPELIRLFRTLPRLPYGVLPVPAYAAEAQPTAYYYPGSLEAGRPGYFFANTYDLASRPKWEMEALTLHEAVPGHHLQIALAQEQEGIPDFRRHLGVTAYIEGWGLYAESLGGEMGFYADPYARFGRLTYEMWRAVRLVVDTGMHAFGWSREQAVDFFAENAGKAGHDIAVEVDRYLVWPGQALAYKLGELKLQELRRRATERLSGAFDVRSFHDEVLRYGALPLPVLEERLEAWIQEGVEQREPSPAEVSRR